MANLEMKSERWERFRKHYLEDLWAFNFDVLGFEDIDNAFHRKELGLIDENRRNAVRGQVYLWPRGHLKSHCVTIGQSLQDICRDPNVRILILNATAENAEQFLQVIATNILENEMLNYFFPDIRPGKGETKWTRASITVPRTRIKPEPTVRALGITSNVVSQHFDKIRFDDIVNDENSDSPDKQAYIKGRHEMAMAVLEPGGLEQIIGTRYEFEDLYASLRLTGLYAWSEHYLQEPTGKDDRDGNKETDYIFPQKFNAKEEDRLRKTMSLYRFSAQYYQRPIMHEDQLFKPEYIKFYDALPAGGHMVITVDPASSTKSHADKSAIVTAYWVGPGKDHPFGAIYVVHYFYDKYPAEVLFNQMFDEYIRFSPEFMSVEVAGSQSGSFWEFLCKERSARGYNGMKIRPFTPSTKQSKYERIAMMEPLFRRGSIYMKEEHVDLKVQLTQYTGYKKHERDDLIDAMAQQLQVFAMPPAQKEKVDDEKYDYQPLYEGMPY